MSVNLPLGAKGMVKPTGASSRPSQERVTEVAFCYRDLVMLCDFDTPRLSQMAGGRVRCKNNTQVHLIDTCQQRFFGHKQKFTKMHHEISSQPPLYLLTVKYVM